MENQNKRLITRQELSELDKLDLTESQKKYIINVWSKSPKIKISKYASISLRIFLGYMPLILIVIQLISPEYYLLDFILWYVWSTIVFLTLKLIFEIFFIKHEGSLLTLDNIKKLFMEVSRVKRIIIVIFSWCKISLISLGLLFLEMQELGSLYLILCLLNDLINQKRIKNASDLLEKI